MNLKISNLIKRFYYRLLGWKPYTMNLGGGSVSVGLMKKKQFKPIPPGIMFTMQYKYKELQEDEEILD